MTIMYPFRNIFTNNVPHTLGVCTVPNGSKDKDKKLPSPYYMYGLPSVSHVHWSSTEAEIQNS